MNSCLCGRRIGSSSSALLCACTCYHERWSCHSDPTLKASTILRCLLEVRPVLPCSCSGLCFSMEDAINNTKMQPQGPQQDGWRHFCGCWGPQLISDSEKGLPREAQSDDSVHYQKERMCWGTLAAGGNEMRLRGRKFLGKTGP